MQQPSKFNCRVTVQALEAYGVRHVVVSPGSRNTSLIMAVTRRPLLKCHSVIDERSAAFIGLGLAEITGEPVALICTSGSAVLNYAPAVAEAFYHKLPLIVVSADRPALWIGQDDSQTIRQPGALLNIVSAQCNIPDRDVDADGGLWRRNVIRELNHTLSAAVYGRRGPVHINVEIDQPIAAEAEMPADADEFDKIDVITGDDRLPVPVARLLAGELENRNVLVFGGFHAPSATLIKALSRLAALPNVVVAADRMANIPGADVIQVSDALMHAVTARPDLLVTFGGAPLSGEFKKFVRGCDLEQWHVGANEATIDMSLHLVRRIEIPATAFFPRLAGAACHGSKKCGPNAFKTDWLKARSVAMEKTGAIDKMPWCDLAAFSRIMGHVPPDANIQLGNGMAVRYFATCCFGRYHRIDSNRGVSGIDGCLSTAVGAAMAYEAGMTVAVIGDMSALYDMGALASVSMCRNLKIIVFNNQGGNIFRIIETTRSVREAGRFIIGDIPPYLADTARGFGIRYFKADSFEKIDDAVAVLHAPGNCIIEICTDGEESAQIYRKYLSQI